MKFIIGKKTFEFDSAKDCAEYVIKTKGYMFPNRDGFNNALERRIHPNYKILIKCIEKRLIESKDQGFRLDGSNGIWIQMCTR